MSQHVGHIAPSVGMEVIEKKDRKHKEKTSKDLRGPVCHTLIMGFSTFYKLKLHFFDKLSQKDI